MSAGKGDKFRPVNKRKFDESYDRIFTKSMPKITLQKKSRPSCPAGWRCVSDAEFEYFQQALKYAKERGFKTTLFNENGKVIALQG